MKAMILAAGFGKRLMPLTKNIPKALIEINNKTLLERLIIKLKESGFNELVINTSYLGNLIIDFLKEKNNFDIEIKTTSEPEPLETGGGIKFAQDYLIDSDFFLVHNVDIISDLDLKKTLEYHKNNKCFATLAVSKRKTSRYLLFDDENNLIGRRNLKTGQTEMIENVESYKEFGFSGIYILSSKIFDYFKEQKQFSIIETLMTATQSEKIKCFEHNSRNWFDLGKIEDFEIIRNQIVNSEKNNI
jgi:MurNAc alpha-1-phosphate uridylyltransferase